MNLWKIATAAIALVAVTGFTTALTTAYLVRSTPSVVAPDPADSAFGDGAGAPSVSGASVVPAVQRTSPALGTRPAVKRATLAASRPATPVSEPAASVRPVASTVAADCATGGDRALRIAKPGVIGALLGAGMGAAGGAIADGGKAAGKGAMIGGLAGAALGSAYGAYKTKQECGTVLGDGTGFAGDRAVTRAATDGAVPEAGFSARSPRGRADGGDRITVFSAR
jgi:hypothetical protein